MTRQIPRVVIQGLRLTGMLAMLALVGACGDDSAVSQAPVKLALPIDVTSAGFTVSLTAVEATSDRTVLTFRISDADPTVAPSMTDYQGLTPLDITLTGLDWSGEYMGSLRPILDETSAAHPKPISAVEETLELGPAQPGTEVTIAFHRLRFLAASGNEPSTVVEGEWTFRFPPAAVAALDTIRLTVGRSIRAEDVNFVVDEVTFDALRTTVRYRIESSRPGELESTGIVARLSDGNFLMPQRITPGDDDYVAVFAPVPAGQEVILALSPLLVAVERPVEISFPVDGQAVAGAAAGTQVPVNASATAAGEQFTITAIMVEEGSFSIRIDNTQPNRSGRVLLRSPNKDEVALIDNLGNTYQLVAASTNFGKADPLTMWADGSSFTFEGSLPTDVSRLTLRVTGYGHQLRGPWEITIAVPAQ